MAGGEATRTFQTWAEADPDSGLSWVKKAVDAATNQKLVDLDKVTNESGGWTGRRQIVWLCEHLASFKEYFGVCEHILFRFAQVETELQISNNSQGVWRSLFMPMLANTEVPFSERLQLLLNHLQAATNEDLPLILDAFSTCIEPPSAGPILPPPVIGGRLTPKFWNPRTYEELDRLQSQAAKSLLAIAHTRPEEQKRKIALWTIENLIRFAELRLIPRLRKLLRQFERDENLSRQLIIAIDEALSRVFPVRAGNSQKRDAIRLNLEKWKRKLRPTGLAGQIKLLVSLDYWGYLRGDDLKASERETEKLYRDAAKRIQSEPSALRELENWLSTDQARSGYELGMALGQQDEERACAYIIKNWLTAGTAKGFSLGYLVGMAQPTNTLPVDWALTLDSLCESQPEVSATATVYSDISTRGFDRLFRIAKTKAYPLSKVFGNLNVKWRSILTLKQMEKVLSALADSTESGDDGACEVGLRLFSQWTSHGRETLDGPTACIALRIAASAYSQKRHVPHFDWQNAVIASAAFDPQSAAKLAANALTNPDMDMWYLHSSAEASLASIAKKSPEAAMSALGEQMKNEQRNYVFRVSVFRDIFTEIGLNVLRKWLEANGSTFAVFVARHLPSPTLDQNNCPMIPPETEWFLNEYSKDDDAFSEFLMGRHSGISRWGGPTSQLERAQAIYTAFKDHSLRRIREWAKYELDVAHREIAIHEEMDDLLERT